MTHSFPVAIDDGKEGSVPALALAAHQERLFEAFLEGRSPQTQRAYRTDLAAFAAFWSGHDPAGCPAGDAGAVALAMLRLPHGYANALALAWRAAMVSADAAPATINRRLAALRSLVKLGRTLGMVTWTLEIDGVEAQKYRDTRGPGADGVKAMIAAARGRADAKGLRDLAIVLLLYDRGLRRGEVVSLDLDHVDRRRQAVAVLGKGRTQRELLTLAKRTMAAVDAWIGVRGTWPGALFVALDPGADRERLTGEAVRRIVAAIAKAAGLGKVRPHGLRHAAITAVLDANGGDMRAAAKFSRHRQIQTLTIYDDNRADLGGSMSELIAEE